MKPSGKGKIMIIDREMLEVAKIAQGDYPHQVINNVKVGADGTMIATNGHILAVVKPSGLPDEDFPVVEGDDEGETKAELEPFMVPADSLIALQKAIPKGRKAGFPILRTARLIESRTNDNGMAVFATTDLEVGQLHQLRKAEGQYPDYQKVLPKGKPKVRVAFNWQLLQALGKIADAVSDSCRNHGLILEIYGPDKPIGIKASCGSERFEGVLMPLQIKGDDE